MICEEKMRNEFNAFVLEWTGRSMEQHYMAGTTGLTFAWNCWMKAYKKAEIAAIHEALPGIAEVAK